MARGMLYAGFVTSFGATGECSHCKQWDTKENMFNGASLSNGSEESYRHRVCYNKALVEIHRRNYVPRALRRVVS